MRARFDIPRRIPPPDKLEKFDLAFASGFSGSSRIRTFARTSLMSGPHSTGHESKRAFTCDECDLPAPGVVGGWTGGGKPTGHPDNRNTRHPEGRCRGGSRGFGLRTGALAGNDVQAPHAGCSRAYATPSCAKTLNRIPEAVDSGRSLVVAAQNGWRSPRGVM